MEQITKDHSLVEELVERGEISREEARLHPRRNVITRALGVEQSVRCDIFKPLLGTGSLLLLCSDGLSNMVGDDEILAAFQRTPEPEPLCRALLQISLDRGAPDNVTIVALLR
jgi:protein phosphatase